MRTILAIDIGTNTGYAYNDEVRLQFPIGTWRLSTDAEIRQSGKTRMNRRRDPRVLRFRDYLKSVPWPDIIVFEDVQFASSTYQVQLWSALRATIWLTFPDNFIDCVPVGTLKKFATGSGSATKPMMAAALQRRYRSMWTPHLDDNAVDAAWLWLWAEKNLSRAKL